MSLYMVAHMHRRYAATGEFIRRRRTELKLGTQEDLAAAIGTTASSVHRWEAGESFPTRYIAQLCRVLQVTEGQLRETSESSASPYAPPDALSPNGFGEPPPSIWPTLHDPQTAELIRLFEAIPPEPPEYRERALEAVETIALQRANPQLVSAMRDAPPGKRARVLRIRDALWPKSGADS